MLIEHKEAERMQMEQLRQELSQEQAAVRALKADEQNDESKLRQRLDLQNAHKQSIAQQAKRQAVSLPCSEVHFKDTSVFLTLFQPETILVVIAVSTKHLDYIHFRLTSCVYTKTLCENN